MLGSTAVPLISVRNCFTREFWLIMRDFLRFRYAAGMGSSSPAPRYFLEKAKSAMALVHGVKAAPHASRVTRAIFMFHVMRCHSYQGCRDYHNGSMRGQTLGQYFLRHGYSEAFAHSCVVPYLSGAQQPGRGVGRVVACIDARWFRVGTPTCRDQRAQNYTMAA
jgi:hypothetical protein